MTNLRYFTCAVKSLAFTIISAVCAHETYAAASKPNIVVILADDFGWGSVGCYGAQGVKTPNLDRLAKEGRRFTQAYAPGSVCSPTRYGLMTGRYYWRTSIKDGKVLPVMSALHIETTRTTLASICKEQGYKTAAFGKWHLGFTNERVSDWNVPLKPGPLEIGFDYFYGLAANPQQGPGFIRNHAPVDASVDQVTSTTADARDATTTSSDSKLWRVDSIMETITSQTCSWIESNSRQPFMVYFAANAVHEPIMPNERFSGSSSSKYADFIAELDARVGTILDTLDRLKVSENTLVIFTSDNGGVVNRGNPNAQEAIKGGLVINGPLREGKHSEYEGGFREPFIVRWPGKVPANTVSDQVVCLTDLVATLSDLFGSMLKPGHAEDSFSVLRALTEEKPGPPVRDHVILQSANAIYDIRQGDWKLVERADTPEFAGIRNPRKSQAAARQKAAAGKHDELYNLQDDPAESRDVIANNGEIAAKLKQALVAARDKGYTRPGAGTD